VFGKDEFSVAIGNDEPKVFDNPIVLPNPRLYLGDGYESDYLPRHNNESQFYIDLDSVKTFVE